MHLLKPVAVGGEEVQEVPPIGVVVKDLLVRMPAIQDVIAGGPGAELRARLAYDELPPVKGSRRGVAGAAGVALRRAAATGWKESLLNSRSSSSKRDLSPFPRGRGLNAAGTREPPQEPR